MTLNQDPFYGLFKRELEKFKAHVQQQPEQSRGQKLIPSLSYSIYGKYLYVRNSENLCNFANRDLKTLASFMSKRAGVSYIITNKDFRLKGSFKRANLAQIERKFYEQEVLCEKCGSPETERKGVQIACKNCNHLKVSR